MRRTVRLTAVLALALLALALLAPALAHPDDGRPHVQSFQENRNVRASTTRTTVVYELDRPSEPTLDTVRLTFDGRTGAVTYEYRGEEARPESAHVFRWVLDRLLEYVDRNANGEYDPTVDAVVQAHPVGSMRWNITEPTTSVIRGVDVTYVPAIGSFGATSQGQTPGELRIQFAAHGRAFNLRSAREAQMHPQDVKMVWNVANFPFEAGNSRLALVTRIETMPGADVLEESDPDGALRAALVSTPGKLAFFDWATKADGNSTREPAQRFPVAARLKQDVERTADGLDSRLLVFSYPRADLLISHDPTMGFEYAPREDPPILPWGRVLGLGALVGGLVLAGVGLVQYRRHGEVPALTRLRERFGPLIGGRGRG